MSLINEALKKAQHQRTGPADDRPPMPGAPAGEATTRGSGMPVRTLVLICGGAAAAIVVSVIVTVFIVNRPAPARVAAARPASPSVPAPASTPVPEPMAVSPKAVAPTPSPQPVATAPAVPAPAPARAPAASEAVVKIDLSSQRLPAADEAPPPVGETKSSPLPTATPAAPAAAEAPVRPGTQDIRILTYIDALRVAGIRSSGTDSKVLMNDKVYRINDMVDYALGIRLIRVANDGLTFTDANGTVYVKNF